MKKGFKFNLVDAVVILVIIAVVGFVAVKLSGGLIEKPKEMHTYRYTFHCYEAPTFVEEYVKEGASVCDDSNNAAFGTVTGISTGEAEIYNVTDDGETKKSTKEDHISMDVVVEGEAEQTPYGVKIEKGVYGVGHTITIKVGNSKLHCKIAGIEVIK